MASDALLAQLKAAIGHGGELAPYAINALLEDACREIERLREDKARLEAINAARSSWAEGDEDECPDCGYDPFRCDEQRGSTCSAACGWCGACS